MATGLAKIFGDTEPESDLVPSVDPADIRNMWRLGNELKALYPDEQIMVGIDVYTELCGPGANVRAVYERTSKIGLLQMAEILKQGDKIDDAVFRALANIPMKRLQVGVVHEGFPFDVLEFVKQVNE